MKTHRFPVFRPLPCFFCLVLLAAPRVAADPPPQSGTVVLTPDGGKLLKVNPSNDTLTIINPITNEVIETVDVEGSPSGVTTTNDYAFVTSPHPETELTDFLKLVSVINLEVSAVIKTLEIRLAAEVLISPNGTRLYVAVNRNNSETVVHVIDVATCADIEDITFHGDASTLAHLAITNDGDTDDLDEKIFVTTSGALEPGKTSAEEGQDDQRGAAVHVLTAGPLEQVGRIRLGPVADTGFDANGQLTPSSGGSLSVSAVASTNPPTNTTPTGATPNQASAVCLHPTNGKGYVVSTGASPNGPLSPSTCHHGLVSVIDCTTLEEVISAQTDPDSCQTAPLNLNCGMDLVTGPVECRYASNPVAMAWEPDGSCGWIVNQNTDCVLRLKVDANGTPTVGAPLASGPGAVVRIDLRDIGAPLIPGKGPDGICINAAGTRAYVSCDLSRSLSVLDISDPDLPFVTATVRTAPLPARGTREAQVLLGQELFQSARHPMSEGWSSCSSCHPGGGTDGLTWMFPDGPRQTIPLWGTFANDNPADQRIPNWTSTADEIADMEWRVRDVAGGAGLINKDRQFHLLGGSTAAGDTGLVERFDQLAGTVTPTTPGGAAIAPATARRDHACATTPDGVVYVIGGRTGPGPGTLVTGSQAVQSYDPRNNQWQSFGSNGFFIPRFAHAAFAVQTSAGSRLYVAGGYPDTSGTSLPTDSVQEFNPSTGAWRTVASLPQPVAQTAACVSGGINSLEEVELLHVVSGNRGSENAPVLLDGTTPPFTLQRFQADPTGPGTWNTFPLPGLIPRRGAAAASVVSGVASIVHVIGGLDAAGSPVTAVQAYTARLATMLTGPRTGLPEGRAFFGITTRGDTGTIYVLGGEDAAGDPRGEIYALRTRFNGPGAGQRGSPSGQWDVVATATPRAHGAASIPPAMRPLLPHANSAGNADWEAIEAYIQDLRCPPAPVPADLPAAVAGRALFSQTGLVVADFSCATCHGGSKWTRSTVDFDAPPSPSATVGRGDERVVGSQLFNTLTQDNLVLRNVGTYDLAISVNEVRPNPSDMSVNNIAFGSSGFNIPSLLGVFATAPYFHSGRAPTLQAVLDGTADGSGSGTRYHLVPNPADRDNLVAFLASIDDSTPPMPFSTAPPATFKALTFDAPLAQLTIDLIGFPGQAYTMESTSNMRTWRTRRSFRAGPAGEFRVVEERPPVPEPREFYRFSSR